MTFLDKVAFLMLSIDILIVLGIIATLGLKLTIDSINKQIKKDEESN